ncbi:MAG: flagellar biosynthesis protein FlhA [Methylococcales bacterium]|jgi:flagellar biosynthesis protein FlhA|nr:flagellar biosynthesis protein FlhA [Methylococcales bacterium]
MDASAIRANITGALRNGVGAPVILVLILSLVIVPMPPMALDLFFTFNIAISLSVLMVVIYSPRPMDFSAFPSVLLITTLFRLGLNIASTRVILLEGQNGTQAAGKVIDAFGDFVIGGNYAVGIIIFSILVIINFMVVTKGAGRVSEVTARFTLDAMPGKQMAIDADLNAGMLTQEEARERREEVVSEADFYGSMDGASKFVRGDAVAGIIILFLNLIGGLIIGVGQHDLTFAVAVEYYTLLTIGDGLVAQIPSLLLSVAAAIMVTRVSKQGDMGGQVVAQISRDPRALGVTAGVIGAMGLAPGMPVLPFFFLAGLAGFAAFKAVKKQQIQASTDLAALPQGEEAVSPEMRELSWDDVPPVDIVGLEVGYRLIPLVDKNQGGQLMQRIKGVRKKISQEVGFLIQPVHIRDNLDLSPNAYRITILGVPSGEAEIYPDKELAINPGRVFGDLQGVKTIDPAFGLEATWIPADQRDHAQTLGYTVVDPSTVIATHLSQLIQSHAHELLGHEEVQQLLDMLSKSAPKLVENLTPGILPIGTVLKVLQNLLEEEVPIRDMRSIAETMAELGTKSQDPGVLTEGVRVTLGRSIIQNIYGMAPELSVVTLEPNLEQILHQSLQAGGEDGGGIEPGLAERLLTSLQQTAEQQEIAGDVTVLLVTTQVRRWLARFVKHTAHQIHVLAYNEIPESKKIKVVANIGQ